MCIQVERYAVEKSFSTKMSTQHADDGTSFEVANVVEDLVDFQSISYWYFDRVRVPDRVELESCLNRLRLITIVSDKRQVTSRSRTYNKL